MSKLPGKAENRVANGFRGEVSSSPVRPRPFHAFPTSVLIQNLRYRPEIDGLRAIAVLAVVLYHAGFGFPGGFIGVDVFFVISGFFITSLIVKELQEGRFSFSGFWERRVRRIIPAIAVVMILTLLGGWFLLLPEDYADVGKSAAFQAIFSANFHFWLGGTGDEKPLQHTWSLAVEEQFYLFLPLILFSFFRLPGLRRRGPLLLLCGLGIILSLAASIYGVLRSPSAAFFFLPTRAWELLSGSFVALLPFDSLANNRRLREFFCWFGLSGILIPCWIYTDKMPFPGLAAVPPCLGTALLIWATGHHRPNQPSLFLARLLSLRLIVFIGLISYSLYLWHWPLFAFSNYYPLKTMTVVNRLAIVAAGFLLAVLSYRYVETPFRKRTICAARSSMLGFGAASIVVVLALGLFLKFGHGFPSRFSPEVLAHARAVHDREFIHELSAVDVQKGHLVRIGSRDSNAPVAVLVWGDTHAMAAVPAFDLFLKEKGLAGRQVTASATAPIMGAYWRIEPSKPKEVKAFNEAVFDYIVAHSIPDVVLVGRWKSYTDEIGDIPLESALVSTVERLVAAGVRPWIFLQVPQCLFNVPRGLAVGSIFHNDLTPYLAQPAEWNGLGGTGKTLLQKVQAAGGHILDPCPGFLDATGTHFVVEKNGMTLYRDNSHLSAEGARVMLIPLLRNSFCLTNGSVSKVL